MIRTDDRCLGLVLNPLAGLGGAVGLKGSDGPDIVARATELGAISQVISRSLGALRAFHGRHLRIVTAAGAMGEAACQTAGLEYEVVAHEPRPTTAAATRRAVLRCREAGAALILFAGGDGTGRDVAASAGDLPILGIPAGVKMYSGVFAISAATAGQIAAAFLGALPQARQVTEAELLDIDEAGLREGAVISRLHGMARIPAAGQMIQRAKASVSSNDDADLAALYSTLGRDLAKPDGLCIVGPGTTMRNLFRANGLPKTLLGVDVLRGGKVAIQDARADEIAAEIDDHDGGVGIIVGVLGGQGCLFGRGNQPISPEVLRRVGRARIMVLAGAAKMAALPDGLFVDSGDPAVDLMLAGHIRIRTSPRRDLLVRLRSGGTK